MKPLPGQITIVEVTVPPWVKCFKTCRHFDSHPEFRPDTFPGTDILRCTYSMKGTGTSGAELWTEVSDNRVEMYCRKYESGCPV